MPNYLSPGVYVEEVDTGTQPIEAVGTTTAGFVGMAPNPGARVNEAVAINGWQRFKDEFAPNGSQSTPLANAVYGFFRNGGSRCYVVNTGKSDAIAGNGRGLDRLAPIDEIAMIAAPGKTDAASYDALLTAAEGPGDRFAILDAPQRVDDVEQLTRVAVVDGGGGKPAEGGGAGQKPGLRWRDSERGFGAGYFPWIRVRDALDPDKIVSVPPSGHVAGIYARTDVEKGVHKAPANTIIRGAVGVDQTLIKADQEVLNPAGVNCIRLFSRDGTLLWGARAASAAPTWRYVPVRRFFIMVEKSIERSTRWAVFEPNDRPLWKRIRRDVGNFLTLLWRQGALMGATPEQAFFVKCDEETNPPEVIDAGQLVIEIGMAPVKPAEIVVFRIGQSAAGTTDEGI